eukprot:5072412-Prymnesium_polylepis.2
MDRLQALVVAQVPHLDRLVQRAREQLEALVVDRHVQHRCVVPLRASRRGLRGWAAHHARVRISRRELGDEPMRKAQTHRRSVNGGRRQAGGRARACSTAIGLGLCVYGLHSETVRSRPQLASTLTVLDHVKLYTCGSNGPAGPLLPSADSRACGRSLSPPLSLLLSLRLSVASSLSSSPLTTSLASSLASSSPSLTNPHTHNPHPQPTPTPHPVPGPCGGSSPPSWPRACPSRRRHASPCGRARARPA